MMNRGAILTGGLLILVLLAGCLDEISDRLDPPGVESDDPHKRLSYVMGHDFVGGSCSWVDRNLPNVIGPNCVDVIAQIAETRCDPAQLWVTDSEDPANVRGMSYDSVEEAQAAQAGVEAPDGAYLHCEFDLSWQFNARSLVPDSEFYVIHETHNQTFKDRCSIPVQSQCSIELGYVANLTVYPGEKTSGIHEEWGNVEIEWFEPILHEVSQSSMVFESEFWFGVN